MSAAADPRICAGCGRRKAECHCWAAGAGDEAARSREGFDIHQLALMDFVRYSMEHGQEPIDTLTVALKIELAAEKRPFLSKFKAAWRLLTSEEADR